MNILAQCQTQGHLATLRSRRTTVIRFNGRKTRSQPELIDSDEGLIPLIEVRYAFQTRFVKLSTVDT